MSNSGSVSQLKSSDKSRECQSVFYFTLYLYYLLFNYLLLFIFFRLLIILLYFTNSSIVVTWLRIDQVRECYLACFGCEDRRLTPTKALERASAALRGENQKLTAP